MCPFGKVNRPIRKRGEHKMIKSCDNKEKNCEKCEHLNLDKYNEWRCTIESTNDKATDNTEKHVDDNH